MNNCSSLWSILVHFSLLGNSKIKPDFISEKQCLVQTQPLACEAGITAWKSAKQEVRAYIVKMGFSRFQMP